MRKKWEDLINSIDISVLDTNSKLYEVLNTAFISLHLLFSSDWQFLITNWSARDYAEQRFSNHNSDFRVLCNYAEKLLTENNLEEDELQNLKQFKLEIHYLVKLILRNFTH